MNKPTNAETLRLQYDKNFIKKAIILAVCVVGAFFLASFSICIGSADLSVSDVWHVLFPTKELLADPDYKNMHDIVWLLRMPRVIMALLAGAGLAFCGTIMQGITRNPLVSSYTVGISNAAAFGVGLMVLFSDKFNLPDGLKVSTVHMIGAFVMAFLCALLVYFIAALKRMNITTLVLMGIALSYLFNALTNTMQYLANEQQLNTIVRWTFGSLLKATWKENIILGIILLICFIISMFYARALNAMASGSEEIPKSLGIPVFKVRLITGVISVLLTSVIVSFVGVIGFVGLVAPHIARMIIGSDNYMLIPFSCICGGVLLVTADTIGRTLFNPITIPVGIVVAFIGVPIFIHLIIREKDGSF